ncbi:MAG TPA: alpha/beta fold hydrolase [Bacteroidia bacterium]|nr:alpha/beta fold hydrolase [Bacteroidia bacterium]
MKLFFKKTGEGKPVFILHGLFGLGDNWMSFSKHFASIGFSCYAIDLRNHGRSPHSDAFSYELMVEDILRLMDDEGLSNVILLGHSLGGKTAMFFTEKYPERIEKLIVVDIAPRYYAPHHQSVLSALNSVPLDVITTRKEAEEQLRISIHEESTLQFLLKNLYWNENQKLAWRFNVSSIEKHIGIVGKAFLPDTPVRVPALFIRGQRSGYISAEDEKEIRNDFSDVQIVTVPDAGHWVHAENPKSFFETVERFLVQ